MGTTISASTREDGDLDGEALRWPMCSTARGEFGRANPSSFRATFGTVGAGLKPARHVRLSRCRNPREQEGMAQPVWTFRFPLPLTLLLKRLCPCAPGSSGLSGTTGDFASETCFAALRVTA